MPKIDIKLLNWWDHNRNITIIINEEKDKNDSNIFLEDPIAATYFYRGSDSRTVSPILLDSKKDEEIKEDIKKELMYFLMHFYAYWLKASYKEKMELDFGEKYEVKDKIKEIKFKIEEIENTNDE